MLRTYTLVIHPGRQYGVLLSLPVALSCGRHSIVLVSFLRFPPCNQCHVLSVHTFSVSLRNLKWSGFCSHYLVISYFKGFLKKHPGPPLLTTPFPQLQISIWNVTRIIKLLVLGKTVSGLLQTKCSAYQWHGRSPQHSRVLFFPSIKVFICFI